jgi:hypothetical protein
MGAVTYPHPDVRQLLEREFVCLRINERSTGPESVEVLRIFRLLWSPGFIFLDHHWNELRRLVGYLPPPHFLAELRFGLGMVEMLHGRYGLSFEHFRGAADSIVDAPVAAEALYWAGIAAYRRDGRSLEAIKKRWEEIYVRYPESSWWTRADVFDVTPLG